MLIGQLLGALFVSGPTAALQPQIHFEGQIVTANNSSIAQRHGCAKVCSFCSFVLGGHYVQLASILFLCKVRATPLPTSLPPPSPIHLLDSVLSPAPIKDPNGRIRWQMFLSAGAILDMVKIRAQVWSWVRGQTLIGQYLWGRGGDV